MKKVKKIAIYMAVTMALSYGTAYAADFEWAEEAVKYCQKQNILQGNEYGDLQLARTLTREQMAKMLVETFNIKPKTAGVDSPFDESLTPELTLGLTTEFQDIQKDRWSYDYICLFQDYMKKKGTEFKPEEFVTREEFAASLVLASGLTEGNIRNNDILNYNFDDASEVDSDYKKLLCIAVERGYLKGSDALLRPKDLLNRAEVCTLLHRVLLSQKGALTLDLGVRQSATALVAISSVPVEQAQQWAKNKGAAEIFINIAPVYWKYGEITGIRPEILYAQAAKETGYGKYTGAVKPEQNNWAGIKTATATGDRTEDHEIFATPDDGVRGHFNHMSAYIGLKPVGEVHARYNSVSKIAWAGSIKTLEQLGGKWCPDLYYGYSVLHNYLEPMMNTEYTPVQETPADDAQQNNEEQPNWIH